MIFAVHLSILSNALLARLPRYERPAHGAGNNTGSHDENRCGQHYPSTPLHVRNKEKYVDQECQERNEEGRKAEYQERKQIPRRMRRRMEVGSYGQSEAYQSEEGRDWVDDEDRGQ